MDPDLPGNGQSYTLAKAELRPASELLRLPLKGRPGQTTSFFVEDGLLEGHVKGAWKPLETLFLGLFSLDLVVGMDKQYGNPQNPFYTSLRPWNREESDMNHFPRFFEILGLESLSARPGPPLSKKPIMRPALAMSQAGPHHYIILVKRFFCGCSLKKG